MELVYAVVGALIWPLIVGLAWLWATRFGSASGLWLQITYGPDDEDGTGPIWSVEIVRARQLGKRIIGTMWRTYPVSLKRRWSFSGHRNGIALLGRYRKTRGRRGESGLLHLLQLDDGWWS